MPSRLRVGCSFEHTACKHTALHKFSGQIAGAGSRLPGVSNVVFIDACTGDGKANPFSLTSSPARATPKKNSWRRRAAPPYRSATSAARSARAVNGCRTADHRRRQVPRLTHFQGNQSLQGRQMAGRWVRRG